MSLIDEDSLNQSSRESPHGIPPVFNEDAGSSDGRVRIGAAKVRWLRKTVETRLARKHRHGRLGNEPGDLSVLYGGESCGLPAGNLNDGNIRIWLQSPFDQNLARGIVRIRPVSANRQFLAAEILRPFDLRMDDQTISKDIHDTGDQRYIAAAQARRDRRVAAALNDRHVPRK